MAEHSAQRLSALSGSPLADLRGGATATLFVNVRLPSPTLPTSRSPLKRPKLRGAACDPPGCVQQSPASDPGEQLPAAVEGIDETEAPPGDVVHALGVVLGVADADAAADRLDAEGSEPVALGGLDRSRHGEQRLGRVRPGEPHDPVGEIMATL
jgi:hypothetical protein